MGKQTPYYWLETYTDVGGWRRMTGAAGRKGYVQGWFDALKGLYPCPPSRIIKSTGGLRPQPDQKTVVEMHPGNAKVSCS